VTTSPARPSRREWIETLALAAVLLVVLTWPTVPRFASAGRLDSGDGKFSIWNVGWIGHALTTDPRHLLDANIFHPHTGTLAYSELNLAAGLFGLPAFAVTGSAIAATNAAILIGLALSFVLTWRLVRRLTGSHGGALVAAAAFTFCPYVQAHTAHVQLLMVFAVPLVLSAFHAFRDDPRVARAVRLGAALAVAGLACAYYGIFAGLGLGLLAIVLGRRDARYWRGIAIALVASAFLVAPAFVPYLAARRAVGAAASTNVDEIRAWSATLATYRSSPSNVHEAMTGVLAPALESLFPGFVTLLLACFGVVHVARRGSADERRLAGAYGVLLLVSLWASFGPDAGLYALLMKVVPAIGFLRAPSRLGVLVMFSLVVFAAFGVRAIAARRAWLAGVFILLTSIEFASLPWPVVSAGPRVPEAYRLLAAAPRGAVVEFPFRYRRHDFPSHAAYMFNSTYHWQPLVNGYSDVIPKDFVDLATPINAFPDPESFALMKRLGVKYVIWHFENERDGYDPVSRQKILDRLPPYGTYLKQLTTDGGVWLYEIEAYP
jgi:hypothetical protein